MHGRDRNFRPLIIIRPRIIANSIVTDIDYNFKFFENCIIEIQTMNPLINENIKYPYDKFYISLKCLFESSNIEIYHKIINWDNYIRKKSITWI